MARQYIWEVPVRVTHWVNVVSIVVLSITGLYIGDPYAQGTDEHSMLMAKMRLFHFIFAYIFIASVIVRIYWWFAGNKYARLDQFIPVSGQRWKNLIDTALFYGFMKKDLPHSPGHTGLAGLTYFFLFVLFLIEIMTGFALYSLSHSGGAIWTILGGWMIPVFGQGLVRFIHHVIMWFIAVFVIIHVYISIHNDLIEKCGLVTSIFNGYKNFQDKHNQ